MATMHGNSQAVRYLTLTVALMTFWKTASHPGTYTSFDVLHFTEF